MPLIIGLTALILFIYSLLLLLYFIGWYRIGNFVPKKTAPHPFISVVIAYRNEEETISFLLNDLADQNYPSHQFEIIMVNDHSDDHSFEIAEKYRLNNKLSLVSLELPNRLSGKKNALHYGIESAKGKLILTTDADCRVSKNWICSFADFYHFKENPKLIIGLVDLKKASGILQGIQNLEFLSLMASGAGATGIHGPIYCNGANLMFEKRTYAAMKDPLEMRAVSGDDTFLLHQIKSNFPDKISVLKCRDAVVVTAPSARLKEFINQRIRWVSKSRYYGDFPILISASIVTVSNLTVLAWMAAAIICTNLLFLIPFGLKMITDWLFITPVLSYFRKKKLHFLVPLLSVLYPLYVVIIAPAGLSCGFTWKGRRF